MSDSFFSSNTSINSSRIPSPLSEDESGICSFTDSPPLLEKVEQSISPKHFYETEGRFKTRQRNEYANELLNEFVKKGGSKNIKAHLNKMDLQQLKTFELALNSDFSLRKLEQDPFLAIQAIEKASFYLPSFAALLGSSISPPVFLGLTRDIANIHFLPEVERKDVYACLDRFLKQATDIQNRRPEILLMIDRDSSDLVRNFSTTATDLSVLSISAEPKILPGIIQDIQDRTVMISEHSLEEAIEGCAGQTSLGRTAQHLTYRIPAAPWGLCEEQHPAKLIVSDDGMVDFDLYPLEIEIPISDPKTLETRTVRIVLPLKGKYTLKEASELVQEMGEKARQGSDNQDTDFAATLRTAKEAMAKAVYDFNDTATRTKGQFALEDPLISHLIINPQNRTLACQAASLGHIFTDDNNPSLLPKEARDFVPAAIHQIPARDLDFLKLAILSGAGKAEITMPILNRGEFDISTQCPFSITTREEIRNGSPYLNVVFNIDGVERQTSYPLYSGERYSEENKISVVAKLEELASSKLLIRDFLLAKAKYLNAKFKDAKF